MAKIFYSLIAKQFNNSTISVVTVMEIGISGFFSNMEPYQNHGFRLSIDGFGFLVNGTALMSGAVNVRPNSTPQ